MNKSMIAIALATGLCLSTAGYAQSTGEQLVDDIITDVIHQTADAARAEVRRKTGIDPLDRGYGDHDDYRPAPSDLNEESVNELGRLDSEYDRKVTKLEEELERNLNKAEQEFRREAGKEDKPGKIEKKREKLDRKVDKAYRKFEEKLRIENERYDRKRDQILAKHSE
ncbi:hypothetical protein KFJ24_05610 [Marinobacter sediminum]|uniref:DUF1682 domain-containing protein n=1 Tax=Marinobacter sediminum TaxID=256323 RepID=UPI0020306023|nr:DUF1682 domain-containing protein [Marinobacter sediminum]MCM0611951.1 hypothetical protein [Marinobacter sediminum]